MPACSRLAAESTCANLNFLLTHGFPGASEAVGQPSISPASSVPLIPEPVSRSTPGRLCVRRRSLSLCSRLAYGWVRVRLFGSLVLCLFTHSVTFISLGIMQTFLLDSEPIGFKGAGDQIWIDYKLRPPPPTASYPICGPGRWAAGRKQVHVHECLLMGRKHVCIGQDISYHFNLSKAPASSLLFSLFR